MRFPPARALQRLDIQELPMCTLRRSRQLFETAEHYSLKTCGHDQQETEDQPLKNVIGAPF